MIEILLALQLSMCTTGLPPICTIQDVPPKWAELNQLTVPTTAPPVWDRVNQALMLGSVGMSSIALGLTMTCTTDQTCREVNPVMRKFLGDGPIRAVVFKSVAVPAATYLVWRTQKGKRRTILLTTLFAVNAIDAIHDIRVMRELGYR